MALSTVAQVAITATLSKTPGLTVPAAPAIVSLLAQLTSGTGAGQADLMHAKTYTVGPSSNTDLDLNGVLVDDFGNPVNLLRVKLAWFRAAVGNTNNVVIGAAAANQWATLLNAAGTVTLRPGAYCLAGADVADATGYAVTAGTGDLLRLTNSGAGTSVSCDVIIIGASA